MLAVQAPIDLSKLKYPLAIEPKYDGVRCIAIKDSGKVTLYSRNMKPFLNFQELAEFCAKDMEDNTVWDGEIISEDFQQLMHRTHAEEGKNDDIPVEFVIFDILTLDEWKAGKSDRPYNVRKQQDKDYAIATCESDLYAYYQEALKNGYEGVMIKNLESPYISGRSNYWLKLKPTDTADLYIMGFEEGKGKHKGKLGALLCEYGKVKAKVGTGFTDAQRERMWADKDKLWGKMIEVEFQSVTKPNKKGVVSLRFPVFKCLRFDKTE